MMWNPGKEGAKNINDLLDEDWNKFLCIESVVKDLPVL
jgi:D-hexose-6-phosphate mutarotase